MPEKLTINTLYCTLHTYMSTATVTSEIPCFLQHVAGVTKLCLETRGWLREMSAGQRILDDARDLPAAVQGLPCRHL
jgi:hypothetical protein